MNAIVKDKVKMVGLVEENLMRLKLVELAFDPKQNVVVISGRNRQGKSSLMDGIAMALGGAKLVPPKPIREGAKEGRVEVTLDNGLKIERRFTAAGSTLTVKSADGAKYPSPQTILDALFSSTGKVLNFDPSAFVLMDPKAQVKVVKDLVGLDFAELDAKRAGLYEERTQAGRDVHGRQTQIAYLTVYPEAPPEEESAAALIDEIQRITTHNGNIETRKAQAREANARVRLAAEKVERLRTELDAALEEHTRLSDDAGKIVEAAMAVEPEDPAPVQARLRTIEETNRKVRANKTRDAMQRQFEASQATFDRLTREIDAIDAEKHRLLAEAKMPLPGLSFTDEGLLLNELPLEQASQAEKLELALAVALALHPRFNLILMRQGSFLDEDAMRRLYEVAGAHDAQVLIERVQSGEEGAVVIEDGAVSRA